MRHLLFTYGTLKKGFQRNHLLKDCKFLGLASTVDKFQLKDRGDFPLMLELAKAEKEAGTGHVVHGELYEVTDETLNVLDIIEGHPNFFKRVTIHVDHEEFLAKQVFAYLITKDKHEQPWYKNAISYLKDVATGEWKTN